MNLKRVGAIALRQFYLLRGSPARIMPMFAWVAIDVVLWGFITRYLNAVSASGFNFVPTMLGAVLLWDFLTRVMQGVTSAFFEDVWSRNFLNIFASPLSSSPAKLVCHLTRPIRKTPSACHASRLTKVSMPCSVSPSEIVSRLLTTGHPIDASVTP